MQKNRRKLEENAHQNSTFCAFFASNYNIGFEAKKPNPPKWKNPGAITSSSST